MFAFLNIGGQEMVIILVIGLLIFGRRLPEVGRSVGRTVAQLRRGLTDFKDQMDRDEDLKDVRSSLREVKRAVDAPRMLANPGRMLRNLTDEALASPGPEPVPEGDDDAVTEPDNVEEPTPEKKSGEEPEPDSRADGS